MADQRKTPEQSSTLAGNEPNETQGSSHSKDPAPVIPRTNKSAGVSPGQQIINTEALKVPSKEEIEGG